MNTPVRKFKFSSVVEADSKEALVDRLRNFASQIETEKLTTGVSGGYSSGTIYELLIDETQTHDTFFKELNEYLDEKARGKG